MRKCHEWGRAVSAREEGQKQRPTGAQSATRPNAVLPHLADVALFQGFDVNVALAHKDARGRIGHHRLDLRSRRMGTKSGEHGDDNLCDSINTGLYSCVQPQTYAQRLADRLAEQRLSHNLDGGLLLLARLALDHPHARVAVGDEGK